jgi:urease gamma subunit
MIRVKATVRGEPDVPPFTRVFDWDEEIFFSSAGTIEEKIQRNMKINANEALITYCSYVVKSIRAGRKDGDIQKGVPTVLSAESVMIGVPETLQAITFEAIIDSKPTRKITLKEPIPASSYIMAER